MLLLDIDLYLDQLFYLLFIYKIKDRTNRTAKTTIKKTNTEFFSDIKNLLILEVPEGFEPSTFSSVARRSNPIELWDRKIKISKKISIIKQFYACCHSLNKNIIKRMYV
jgi:hypothetical protein